MFAHADKQKEKSKDVSVFAARALSDPVDFKAHQKELPVIQA